MQLLVVFAALLGASAAAWWFRNRGRTLTARIQFHMAQGRLDKALPLLERQLKELRAKKGDGHLDTAVAKYTLGDIRFRHGNQEEGRTLVQEAAQVFARYDGPRNDDFWVYFLNLGLAMAAVERRMDAAGMLQAAVDLRRKLDGKDTDAVAQALSNLGAVLESDGRQMEAVPVLEEALAIRNRLEGEESLGSAIVHINLAEARIGLEQWTGAETSVRKAVSVLKDHPGPQLGQAYDTWARLLEERGLIVEAAGKRELALQHLRRAAGEKCVDVAQQMERLAKVLDRLDRKTESEMYIRKAAELREALR